MKQTTRWWWIRHAPVPNHDGRLYGRRDVDADVSDRGAISALAARLPRSALWVASPLSRARQTANALMAAAGATPAALTIESDLIEQDFGAWQGMTYAEITAASGGRKHPLAFAPADMVPDGGESFSSIIPRIAAVIARLTKEQAGGDIVAVAHAGTIRAALAVALNLEPEAALLFAVATLSLTRLDYLSGAEMWRVESVNATL